MKQDTRFQITDDTEMRRFRIRWRGSDGKQCSRQFSYVVKDKDDQKKAAEDCREELIRTVKKKEWKPRSFGSILQEFPKGQAPRWVFTCTLEDGKYTRSFSIKKYGDDGAFLLAEKARLEVFPECE